MLAMTFQLNLRTLSERLVKAHADYRKGIADLFEDAREAAEAEPELFTSIVQGEQARLQRVLNEPFENPLRAKP